MLFRMSLGLSCACADLACRHLRTVFLPTTEEQCVLIVELARREGTSVRCAGAGHSPSDLACTQGYMIRTDKLDALVEVRFQVHE